MVQDRQSNEGQRHAKQIEEQWRCVLKSVLHEYEGRSPDEYDRKEQDVGQCCGA